jgi:hypothetical protein
MDEIPKRRLKGALLFSILGLLLFGIFYGAYHGPWDPRLRNYVRQGPTVTVTKPLPPPPAPFQDGTITLRRGRRATVGKRALIYYGVKDNQIHLAVYVLDLDPQVAYHHRIPLQEAEKGFRAAGHVYHLISQSRSSIRLTVESKAADASN